MTIQKNEKLRDRMPTVAKMIDEKRALWGDIHVKDCIKAAMQGEPNRFYAFEAGLVVGTPFDPASIDFEPAMKLAAMVGGAFMAMREPKVAVNGKN